MAYAGQLLREMHLSSPTREELEAMTRGELSSLIERLTTEGGVLGATDKQVAMMLKMLKSLRRLRIRPQQYGLVDGPGLESSLWAMPRKQMSALIDTVKADVETAFGPLPRRAIIARIVAASFGRDLPPYWDDALAAASTLGLAAATLKKGLVEGSPVYVALRLRGMVQEVAAAARALGALRGGAELAGAVTEVRSTDPRSFKTEFFAEAADQVAYLDHAVNMYERAVSDQNWPLAVKSLGHVTAAVRMVPRILGARALDAQLMRAADVLMADSQRGAP